MRGHRHTVILVDDEGERRDAVRDRLEAVCVDVLCARHGRAALQLLTLGLRACVFLVDLESPAVAGAELRRALQYDPSFRDVPVFVLPPSKLRARNAADELDVEQLLCLAAEGCLDLLAFRRPASRRRLARARRPQRGPRVGSDDG